MDSLLSIMTGWANFIKADHHTKQMMRERIAICNTCPFREEITPLGQKLLKFIHSSANLFKCSKCKCPLSAATASPSKACPIGKWKEFGNSNNYY
ncbi:MAG: hypothetical protein EKK63_02640 [Acinetobacter sp.]|uniref:hypothetical protein n=1 Tax=Acinetobacter sp. TaxID=472 RepID=UPI000FA5A5EC|nr:hypothetical protein [Acinetobacter sp.]RUP42215.1 MAG: hypothetical protein EKK63_02640 [Acinetobacter sp.]